MLRTEIDEMKKVIPILPSDKRWCKLISIVGIIQILMVYITAGTIFNCVWSVDTSWGEFDSLLRVMYLYDADACGVKKESDLRVVNEIIFSNDSRGFDVKPIKRSKAKVIESGRLAANTRRNLEGSITIHTFWLLMCIFMLFICCLKEVRVIVLRYSLTVFLWMIITICVFDISMGIMYLSHVQHCLTKGMVIRYSGWLSLEVRDVDEFGGWLAFVAAIVWMKGIVVFCFNVYACGVIKALKKKIVSREVRRKLMHEGNRPIPEAYINQPVHEQIREEKVLYFRVGEEHPFKQI